MDYEKLLELRAIVSDRIDELLKNDDFNLSIDYLKYIHRYIFKDILINSGSFREYNITKGEPILNYDTVNYTDFHAIEFFLRYDLGLEKRINYHHLTNEEIAKKIANITSRIWLVHPFSEGNTRTTCIFVEKYLKSKGFEVDNKIFKDNAVYFRNALVVSNYYNSDYQIHCNELPLINFYRKALIDENIELDSTELLYHCLFENNKKTLKKKHHKSL